MVILAGLNTFHFLLFYLNCKCLIAFIDSPYRINNTEDTVRQSQMFWGLIFSRIQTASIWFQEVRPQDMGFFDFSQACW
jgi:hypothetical protein